MDKSNARISQGQQAARSLWWYRSLVDICNDGQTSAIDKFAGDSSLEGEGAYVYRSTSERKNNFITSSKLITMIDGKAMEQLERAGLIGGMMPMRLITSRVRSHFLAQLLVLSQEQGRPNFPLTVAYRSPETTSLTKVWIVHRDFQHLASSASCPCTVCYQATPDGT